MTPTPYNTADRVAELQIVAERSVCSAFPSGYCWSCNNPHYTGHYKTADEAVAAAKVKYALALQRQIDGGKG